MKKIIEPVLIYLLVCLITLLLPASEGYDTIGWKLLVGQIYAIPAFIVAIVILFIKNRRISNR